MWRPSSILCPHLKAASRANKPCAIQFLVWVSKPHGYTRLTTARTRKPVQAAVDRLLQQGQPCSQISFQGRGIFVVHVPLPLSSALYQA
jgi:hypothetical protein